MSKIALIDKAGDLHSLANRLRVEGHAVRYYIRGSRKDPDLLKIGRGLVDRVDTIRAAVDGVEAVIAYGLPEEADVLREAGVPVWGCSAFSKKLEDDRAYAHELCEKAGIACPEFHEFATGDEAGTFARAHADRAWVFKAEGNVAATTTHVCKTPEELQQVLESEGKNPEVKKFLLEEFIEGVEVSTEGWFDWRKGWLQPFNSTLERKRFGAGDIGPNVGCMGSVVFTWPGARARLVREVLAPMTETLERERYVGPFDHNAILRKTDGKPFVLEPTPRLGWDAFEALGSMVPPGTLGTFCVALAKGEAIEVPIGAAWGAALRIFMPLKPDEVRQQVPYPALDIPEGEGFWLKDVFRDGKTLRSTQTEPNFGFTIVAEVTAAGYALAACLQTMYDRVEETTIDGAYYRNDIGEQATKDLKQLAAWGYEVPGTERKAAPRTRLTGRHERSLLTLPTR